jgi:DNA-binding IclR family transcriptional regulator
VSGTIQSIERAAAMLRLLGAAGRPLALGEVASPLDLPRPTAHGILRTLRCAASTRVAVTATSCAHAR